MPLRDTRALDVDVVRGRCETAGIRSIATATPWTQLCRSVEPESGRRLGWGRRLPLRDDLFAADALCFLNACSRSFCLAAGSGGPSVTVQSTGFPHLALWSKPGAPFVSMATWTGHSDLEGYEDELADKPSMRLLPAGFSDRYAVNSSIARGHQLTQAHHN